MEGRLWNCFHSQIEVEGRLWNSFHSHIEVKDFLNGIGFIFEVEVEENRQLFRQSCQCARKVFEEVVEFEIAIGQRISKSP